MLGDTYEKIMFCLIKQVDLCQMSILNIIIYLLVLVLIFNIKSKINVNKPICKIFVSSFYLN